MGGGDTTTKTTSQSSETNPWAPAQPLLQSILGKLGGINTDVTGGQSTALANLNNAASGIPDLSAGINGAVTGALGTSTAPQQGMLADALAGLKKNLGSTASGEELNPYSTPGFSDAINAMTRDITKNVKGVYAGSGRDPSGAGSFAGSLGEGLTRGIAPVIQSQYNQNKQNQMGAATNLFNSEGATAGGLTSQQMQQLAAQFQGLQGAGALPGLLTAPATAQLGAANASYTQPLTNIGALSSLVNPIAALGSQSSGTGTTTQESSKSLFSNILGGATGLAGLNGALGNGWLGSLGSSLGSLFAFSDERLKTDIEPIGSLDDGQTVYKYKYIDSPRTHIGLLAQEVLEHKPEAVRSFGGYLAVDYDAATKEAA